MLNFKRLGRYVACLLLCGIALTMLVNPASALSATFAPFAPSVIPEGPAITIEDPVAESAGHQVSVVRRSAYYSSTVIGCFEDGTKLTVLGTSGDFYKVDCYDMNGYIAKSQVTEDENGEYYVNCNKDSSETRNLESRSIQDALTLRSAIRDVADDYFGVPYVWGGTSPRGFDCSGLTQYVFNKAGMSIDRSVIQQMADGIIVAKEDLQCGDLVIFSYTGTNGSFASHVGIYIGNDQIIHASSSRGVTVDSLSSPYYVQHYQCARRLVLSDLAPAASIPVAGIIQNTNGSFWRENSQPNGLGTDAQ